MEEIAYSLSPRA